MRVSTTEIFLVDVSFIQYCMVSGILTFRALETHRAGQGMTSIRVLVLLKKVPEVEEKPERDRI